MHPTYKNENNLQNKELSKKSTSPKIRSLSSSRGFDLVGDPTNITSQQSSTWALLTFVIFIADLLLYGAKKYLNQPEHWNSVSLLAILLICKVVISNTLFANVVYFAHKQKVTGLGAGNSVTYSFTKLAGYSLVTSFIQLSILFIGLFISIIFINSVFNDVTPLVTNMMSISDTSTLLDYFIQFGLANILVWLAIIVLTLISSKLLILFIIPAKVIHNHSYSKAIILNLSGCLRNIPALFAYFMEITLIFVVIYFIEWKFDIPDIFVTALISFNTIKFLYLPIYLAYSSIYDSPY